MGCIIVAQIIATVVREQARVTSPSTDLPLGAEVCAGDPARGESGSETLGLRYGRKERFPHGIHILQDITRGIYRIRLMYIL